jgi:hypothetical protein
MKRENEGKSLMLTEKQQQWVDLQKNLRGLRALPRYMPPSANWRRAIFDVVTRDWFDVTMTMLILVNSIQMATYHAGMSPAWETASKWLNLSFTLIYVLEALAKVVALGVKGYLRVSGPAAAAPRLCWHLWDGSTCPVLACPGLGMLLHHPG